VNTPLTSSAGRLFDVLSALLDMQRFNHYEGQAAMKLEFAADTSSETAAFDYFLADGDSCVQIDWQPMFEQILDLMQRSCSAADIARRFHNTLVEIAIAVCKRIGEKRVVLSGGCFQNRLLSEKMAERLCAEDFRVYFHQRVPPNDGGICIGQVAAARQPDSRCN
jgi:hydrogenase maturation protein HypF